MAYRNGTYIAFHAEGTTDPTASDIKYFNMMKAWHQHDDISFGFVNSHDKVAAVRDTSKKATIYASLRERLGKSKNMILIVGGRTRFDTDFVPYEIAYAVDTCKIPIIVVYPSQGAIQFTRPLRSLWPEALRARIDGGTARTLHIPFGQGIVDMAVRQFNLNNLPPYVDTVYDAATYRRLGYMV